MSRFIMAHSRRFPNDLFISYAHRDNEDGWVTTFQEQLQTYLSRVSGEVARLWWDGYKPDSQTPENIEQIIAGALSQSALLVVIASPAFLPRSWFQIEYQRYKER